MSDQQSMDDEFTLHLIKNIDMRYGENPHQKAAYFLPAADGPNNPGNIFTEGKLHGKELSYNNIADISAAFRMLADLDDQACVAIKHSNPCGAASRATTYESFKATYEGDSMSIFGGIIGFKGSIGKDTAELLSSLFLEIIIAESYTEEALALLSQKKNIRLLEYKKWKETIFNDARYEIKRVIGGYLLQEQDHINPVEETYQCVTKKQATEADLADLKFAQTMVKHVKSNAIVVVKNRMLLGVGAGQMNRVTAAKLALDWAGDKAKGAVLGSDAYFPMDDTVRLAAARGITTIAQPGGSIKDGDSIKAADELGIAMYFTGNRHFYH